MSILSEAPLIETIFELRWGTVKREPNKPLEFEFKSEDIDFFPGQFKNIANEAGFTFVEPVNEDFPSKMPYVIKYRFRREKNTWPCYQIGLGIFAANQLNEGYTWESFKKDILTGLEILDKGHPFGLEKLPAIGVELRYQDGFLFTEKETPSQFLKNKLNIGFSPPENFLKSPNLEENVQDNNLSFAVKTKTPKGLLIIKLIEGLINGQPGFIMDIMMRSSDELTPVFNIESLNIWLEEAHDIHRHAFNTLIEQTYLESLK